ncbi:MAG: Ig-like domain-containing protein [Clostridia bacterium]|nr:Ig-like domain-containing protein [Clostridia bacterium]
MKNLKKLLSVIIAVALVVTTMIPAFAADTAATAAKTDAEKAYELGVVLGDKAGEAPSAAFLAKETQRYQAAIMFLRLIGKEGEAKVFEAKENFKDATKVSAGMQKYLAYLFANKDLGWSGTGNGNFAPLSTITAQQFYKVLLEALGYKANVDFPYADTIKFAKEKGLVKVAGATKFTNNDLAVATIEALGADIKAAPGTTLAKSLVDKKILDEAKVKAAAPEVLVSDTVVATPTPAPVAPSVYGVTAVDGQITVVLNGDAPATVDAADFKVTKAINGGAAASVTASVYGYTYTTKTAVLTVDKVAATDAEQSVVYGVGYKDTAAVSAAAFVIDAGILAVKEVTPLNGAQVKIVFNKALDATAGANKDNYSIKDSNGASVTIGQVALSTDKKEATLTLGASAPAALTNGGSYTLTITKDITSSATTTPTLTTALTKTFTAATDVSVPSVTKVEAIGNKIIRVTFSEPVNLNGTAANIFAVKQSNGTFVDGKDYANTNLAAAYVASTGYTQVDVTATTAMPQGAKSLQVLGSSHNTNYISDALGYKMATVEKAFDVAAPSTVAQATDITISSRTEVIVKFDAAVTAGGTLNWATTTKTGVSNPGTKDTDSSIKYTFSAANALPVGNVEFTVPAVTDAYGNTTATKKITKAVSSSAAVSVTAAQDGTSQTSVKVTFSTDMVDGTGTNGAEVAASYSITKPDGTKVTPSSVSYASKVSTLTLSAAIDPGSYTVTVTGVNTELGDASGAVSATFTVTDQTPVASISAEGVLNNAGNEVTIYIDYPENMMFSGNNSVLNAANILIKDAAGPTYYAMNNLPTGYTATITKVNEKRVKVVITHASTDYVSAAGDATDVKVQLVADAAGNVAPSPVEDTSVKVTDTTSTIDPGSATYSAANSINVTSARTITFVVSGKKYEAATASDFVVYSVDIGQAVAANAVITGQTPTGKASIAISSVAVSYDADNTKTTFTLTTGADIPVTTKDIYVATNAGTLSTADVVGLKFTADKAFANGLNTTNAVKAANKIPATISKVSVVGTTKLRVTFDKAVAVVAASDFIVTTGTSQVPTLAAVVSGTSNKVYELTLGTAIDAGATPTVKTVAANIQSEDTVGVKIAANTTGVVASNARALTVSMTTGATLDLSTIVVTFDTAVDPDSIVSSWTGAAPDAGNTVTFDDGVTDKITISGVGELALAGTTGTDADVTFTDASYSLSSDKKTLTITLGSVVTAADPDGVGPIAQNTVAAANAHLTATTSSLTLDSAVKNSDGVYYNGAYTLMTGTFVK